MRLAQEHQRMNRSQKFCGKSNVLVVAASVPRSTVPVLSTTAAVGRNIPDVADSTARVVTARFRKKVHFQAPSSPSPSSSSASNAPAMQETSNLLVAYKDLGRQLDQATRNCDYHLRAQIMEQREIIRQAMRDHRQRNKVLNPRGPM